MLKLLTIQDLQNYPGRLHLSPSQSFPGLAILELHLTQANKEYSDSEVKKYIEKFSQLYEFTDYDVAMPFVNAVFGCGLSILYTLDYRTVKSCSETLLEAPGLSVVNKQKSFSKVIGIFSYPGHFDLLNLPQSSQGTTIHFPVRSPSKSWIPQ